MYGLVPPPSSLSASKKPILTGKRSLDEEKKRQYDEMVYQQNRPGPSEVTGKTRSDEADSYFDDDSDEEQDRTKKNSSRHSDSEEEDELDLFMAGIEKEAKKAKDESHMKEQVAMESNEFAGGQTGRNDIEEEDMQESYFKFMEEYKAKHEEDETEYEYDEDGNIIWTWKKVIEPLKPVDHSTLPYKPFNKTFYKEHSDVSSLTPKQVFEFRMEHEIRVFGHDAPKPVQLASSFGHLFLDKKLLNQISRAEFEKPTSIQAQAIPAILRGRDVLGLAETGSGKTLAYLWPAIIHIINQDELSEGDGPIAVVVVPTRELAIQIYQQAMLYCRPFNINVVCAYGGGSKYEQTKALEEGAELVICTPGRIIDMIKIEATNFLRTTFLVFDEVDRMFDLGFEAQVKSISDHIRPDRQCLMFSATMKPKLEKLAVHALNDSIKIVCGGVGEANADIEQTVIVFPPDIQAKLTWLYNIIVQLMTMGKVLIFVSRKIDAEDVAKKLQLRNTDLVLLHGDMHQHERNEKISAFRTKTPVLVATDVAARGLDIPEIKNVVNFDVAKDIETHVHRVGRTGRAGQKGFAYTLVTEKDAEFCAHLVKNFDSVGQSITPELMQVALKCEWFKKQQEQQGDHGDTTALVVKQRLGLGFTRKEHPEQGGFGFSSTQHSSLGAAVPKQTISKTIERAKTMINSGAGIPGANKVDMMRSAFKGSYLGSFKKATDESAYQKIPASDPRPDWKKQLEERADRINKQLSQNQEEKEAEKVPKKKSRWE